VDEDEAEEEEGLRLPDEEDLSDETNDDIVLSEESVSSANASQTSSSHEVPTSSVSPKPRLKRHEPSGATRTVRLGRNGRPAMVIATRPTAAWAGLVAADAQAEVRGSMPAGLLPTSETGACGDTHAASEER
jgi:hypothetical protein